MIIEQKIRYNSPLILTMSMQEAAALQNALTAMLVAHAQGNTSKDSVHGKVVAVEYIGAVSTMTECGNPASFGLIMAVEK